MKLTPAAQSVYDHMVRNGFITSLEALAVYRIQDLAGRICEVRRVLKAERADTEVKSVRCTDAAGARYTRYTLIEKPSPRGPIFIQAPALPPLHA